MDLEKLKIAGDIHKQVYEYVKTIFKPKIKLFDLSQNIENKINELCNFNNQYNNIAFPVGISINNCAAHWTPNSKDNKIELLNDDLCKIDYGIQIDGNIIDGAYTLSLSNKYDELIEIAKTATNIGINESGIDAVLGDIGSIIQEYIESNEITINDKLCKVKSTVDICGHLILPYKIHGNKAVPNIKIQYNERMKEDETYAIETFPTTGNGKLSEDILNVSHYMFNYNKYDINKIQLNNNLFNKIKTKYNTLAFCKKWLDKYNEKEFNELLRKDYVKKYPPLYDIPNSYIAQYEKTIYIKSNGVEILN